MMPPNLRKIPLELSSKRQLLGKAPGLRLEYFAGVPGLIAMTAPALLDGAQCSQALASS